MINSKTLIETAAGHKANIVPLTGRMQVPLAIPSSKGANTAVKRCSIMITNPAGKETTGAEIEAEDRVSEAKVIASRWVSPTGAGAEANVITRRWVSATDEDADLTVPANTAGANMAITVDLDVGEIIINGNRSIIENMQKGK